MFVGIDLAADPRRTGLATLADHGDSVVIEDVVVGADDDALLTAILSARRCGVDVPFGWPRPFTDLVTAHRAKAFEAPLDTGPHWRREVLFRATDAEVRRRVGKVPLSVAADKIAWPTIRWAGIAARLRDLGQPVPLEGTGIACEVYPGGALAAWGFSAAPYKGPRGASSRAALVEAMSRRWPALDWAGHRDLCAAHDDALDAVISALVAREVTFGRAVPPPPHLLDRAREEGWIWLPVAD